METLWQDIRYGIRILSKSPAFTVVAIITLALGIGANTAIFSVVNGVVLRPLSYPEPEKLMMVFLSSPQHKTGGLGNADYYAVKDRNHSFEHFAAISYSDGFSLTGSQIPERIQGVAVTAEFFSALGVNPYIGRAFQSDEDQPEKPATVVVSYSFWQSHLNGDQNAIGKQITLNNSTHTVIGILPADFKFLNGRPVELFPILQLAKPTHRPPYYLETFGRLKNGVTAQQANADLADISRQLLEQYPNSGTDAKLVTDPMKGFLIARVHQELLMLFGAVAFLLLIAIVNVASLQLSRGAAREREYAIRAALGASRSRVVRQLLTESVLLGFAGGIAGLVLAFWGVRLLKLAGPTNLPRLQEVGVDYQALAFTLAASIVSGILFGLVPAVQSRRSGLNESLKDGGKGGSEGASRRRLRGALVVAEFALSLVLLIGAGLMIRSFLRLQSVDPGFSPTNVLSMEISLPNAKYPRGVNIGGFYDQLIQKVKVLPGVQYASVSMSLPPDRLVMHNPFVIEGQPVPPGQSATAAEELLVTPEYFKTLGIPFLRGRNFDENDTADKPDVIIINETMAHRYFPDGDAVGKRLQTGEVSPGVPFCTIIGVVGDVKYTGLDQEKALTMYAAYSQNLWWRSMYLIVKTTVNPPTLASAIRQEVWNLDKDLPVTNIKVMDELMHESVSQARFRTSLLGLFGMIGLIMAAVGIYGVVSYMVTQRTNEIGIRMALGAQRWDVLKLVLSHGLTLALIGVGIGIVACFALTSVMTGLLYDVSPTDPMTFIGISGLLTMVAVLACYIPARRATKVDPMISLRYE